MTSYLRLFAIAPLLLFASCADDPSGADGSTSESDPGTGSGTAPATTTAPETTTAPATTTNDPADSSGAPASPFDCVEQNFQPSPLAGPGIDPETGAIVGAPQKSYVLHTTQAVLDPETVDAFNMAVGDVVAQAMQAEGLIGLSFSTDMNCGYARTLGIWESETAMLTFVSTGAHAQAMSDAPNLIATGRFTHFDIAPEDVENAWTIALEHIETVEAPDGY